MKPVGSELERKKGHRERGREGKTGQKSGGKEAEDVTLTHTHTHTKWTNHIFSFFAEHY